MNQLDYTYVFDDIAETGTNVKMMNHHSHVIHDISVQVKDTVFHYGRQKETAPLIADLVDLAVSVYVADRLSKPQKNKQCQTRIVLPVRCTETSGNSQSLQLLETTLYQYTNDHWSFEFSQRTKIGRDTEQQLCIPYSKDIPEVALWSGGLDSLAGFVNRKLAQPNRCFTLFGTGSNKFINGRQQHIIEKLRSDGFKNIGFIQILFYLEGVKDLPKNNNLRSRGFTFTLLGAVCAYLEGQNKLHIYENGTGAINLPFPGGVGLDHSRAVHPLSLLKLSDLISFWLNKPFTLHNPFLFWTKARMCEVFVKIKLIDLISQTITCDSRFRQPDQPPQCGFCSSCLLRRQALIASGIPDKTDYVITQDRVPKLDDGCHLRAMLQQVETLQSALNSEHPWRSISKKYPDLIKIVNRETKNADEAQVFKENLLQLYRCYVDEWHKASDIVSVGFNSGQCLKNGCLIV